MNQIDDKLFVGNYIAATDRQLLTDNHIRLVITVCDFRYVSDHQMDGIEYFVVDVNDTEWADLLTYFEDTRRKIANTIARGDNVLVHCRAGVSRGPTVVTAYLMATNGWTYERAYQLVKSRRSSVNPNPGFVNQLKLYEQMNLRLDANYKKFRRHILTSYMPSIGHKFILKYFERRNYVENLFTISMGKQYHCIGCGKHLFNETHVIENNVTTADVDQNGDQYCNKLYIEPQEWMAMAPINDVIPTPVKSLVCPNHLCVRSIGQLISFNVFVCHCPRHKSLSCLHIQIFCDSIVKKFI
ncbi:dual specificity protein phosphatase 12-like [Oppia nitens]|uniref:dual specificity protein phosphatase 12-like n=1 Tax=Oppia nitens TaxID=1686743 RepID=UPI0023DBBA14|nr:dual specificity protein phosphatase 12-like [Oppia nitens]